MVEYLLIFRDYYLLSQGFVTEPFEFLRLHEPQVQQYLTEINDQSAEQLKSRLQQIIQDNSRTIHYKKNSHIVIDYKTSYLEANTQRSYQLTKKTSLNKLDQLVYATSLSNSDRDKDVWNVMCFVKNKSTVLKV